MPTEDLIYRQGVVLAIALIYWAGVAIQARKVQKMIGRQPNVRPRGTREKLLWLGWMLVVFTWMLLPFLVSVETSNSLLQLNPELLKPFTLIAGVCLVIAGYAGTHWCYASMGDTWRMGIDHDQTNNLVTDGPYRWIRHPIYAFQVVILMGVALLLPAWLALLMIPLHLVCTWIKTADEEAFLLTVHGQTYRDYCAGSGRLFPRLISKKGSE